MLHFSKMCSNATFREIHIRIEYWHLLAAICQEDKNKINGATTVFSILLVTFSPIYCSICKILYQLIEEMFSIK